MATEQESLNSQLHDYLKTKRYNVEPLDYEDKATDIDSASVFRFMPKSKTGAASPAYISIDPEAITVWFDENRSKNDASWYEFVEELPNWSVASTKKRDFKNIDRLGDDMKKRKNQNNQLDEGKVSGYKMYQTQDGTWYVEDEDEVVVLRNATKGEAENEVTIGNEKLKKNVAEGYHPMGKKASYNDNIPAVKIILQHNRQLEEGEQRYRNIAKIFLENQDGERFLAPTTRPGIAQVYARHIAEGGVPNDDRWNHIKSMCEEYNKMSGFVRATKNKQFNESAQSLVNEGINHYQSLRETLGKLRGHRGYNQYFESWTPALMEDDTDSNAINELFVQETVDPRIESVMPILNRLYKKTGETPVKEVKDLEQWADSIVEGEKISEIAPVVGAIAGRALAGAAGAGRIGQAVGSMVGQGVASAVSGNEEESLDEDSDSSPVESAIIRRIAMVRTDLLKHGPEKVLDAVKEVASYVGDVDEIGSSDVSGWIRQVEEILGHQEVDEAKSDSFRRKFNKAMSWDYSDPKEMIKKIRSYTDQDLLDLYHHPEVEKQLDGSARSLQLKLIKQELKRRYGLTPKGNIKPEETLEGLNKSQYHDKTVSPKAGDTVIVVINTSPSWHRGETFEVVKVLPKGMLKVKLPDEDGPVLSAPLPAEWTRVMKSEVEEGLDKNQKRVGQLGPTETVGKEGAVGKLVGVSEATNVTDYNPKSQGGTRKELLAIYAKTKDPKDARRAMLAGASQFELRQARDMRNDEYDSEKGISESYPDFKEGSPEHEVVMDLINGNLDAYDAMNHPRTLAQEYVAGLLQFKYDTIAGNLGYLDDDHEKILSKVVDELEDMYGSGSAMNEGQEDLDIIKRLMK
jgi:hypothetical protein